MNPFDNVPTTGGMNTASSNTSNTGNNSKKSNSKKLGYINFSVAGQRVGTMAIETEPFGFSSNEVHAALVELFSLDLTPEQLREGIEELITLGVTFDAQLASKPKEQQKPAINFAAKFGANKRTLA